MRAWPALGFSTRLLLLNFRFFCCGDMLHPVQLLACLFSAALGVDLYSFRVAGSRGQQKAFSKHARAAFVTMMCFAVQAYACVYGCTNAPLPRHCSMFAAEWY